MKLLSRIALATVALAASVLSWPTSLAAQAPINIPVDKIVAVVGQQPILWSDVLEEISQRRAAGLQVPEDSTAQLALAKSIIEEMIDVEVMVQRAKADTSITVEDADLTNTVEQQMKRLRDNFKTDGEFAAALKGGGFGNVEEYKRWLTDQARRRALQERLVAKMKQDGKMISVAVSEEEITEAFGRERERLPKRPATVTFRQIVVPTVASEASKKIAYAKAESIYKDLTTGGDFEKIAKRVSEDSGSAVQGGDLGWSRRGQMVPAFDEMMFLLPPGQISPIVETQFGFHIIRVDRVQPAERKARHILIKPKYDSADVAIASMRADSVLALWEKGTTFDTLVARYHDTASDEAKGVLEPFERSRLPESYQKAFEGKKNGDFITPFPVDDKQRGVPKYVIAQLVNVVDEGEYTVQDLRNQIRDQLSQEKSYRRLLDGLRKDTYVTVLLDAAEKKSAASQPN
ncbi:MAG: peptidylprolyl isomerase [Gemmatimonadaceae bacterium]|jgi:peptidyl-prolyl cis-trans isomerase SurA|nr:peptidylprolyl isomerase [Gemmatimonadota bacterium]MCC7323809.1 peptidylprolyl isomerase [Gemmatimonadaceae bacterium]MBK7835121.1 peptidylprolyl isomerase [Gemmatimonadota bacterium]MBK8061533.1 peptidylprolyl isomerase [Gemmatimonadota bacterium]MBK9406460.1 peptidylprolyl isomerase [Gemmatimonadota bacterium]